MVLAATELPHPLLVEVFTGLITGATTFVGASRQRTNYLRLVAP